MLGRFTRDVPRFLRKPIGIEAAREKLQRDLAFRQQRFLAVADRAIYARPTSPYARLLRNAGCEETLPARFGGTSVDYQLAEEESRDSATRLVLRISPSVGPLDDAAVRTTLLDELGREGVVERHNAEVWRQVGTVRISRETSAGDERRQDPAVSHRRAARPLAELAGQDPTIP